MENSKPTMAQQVARAASEFQQQRTGHAPESVTVVLSENSLVITLQGALTPAEKAFAHTATGAAQVQEFHRELFANSAEVLRQQIRRITGVDVRGATAQIETTTGSLVQVFATGTMVQVFLLEETLPTETWSGTVENVER